MMDHLRKTAADLELPFGERKKTYNSRLSQELGLWAESKRKGDAFHKAVFKTYFSDGRNIAKIPVLLELATSVGLPVKAARSVLVSRAFKTAVDADWNLAREKAITAVPTLVINQDMLVGAQPYGMMEKLIQANGVKKRKGVK